MRDNDTLTLEGDDCYLQLLDDIYHTTKGKKAEVLFIYADNSLVNNDDLQALLRIRKEGTKWRFLSANGNTHLTYPINEYRWFPKKFFKRNIHVIYGNKVAMGVNVDKSRNLTTKITVIDSTPLAEATRNLFEFIWENCRKPSHNTAPKVYD